MCAMKWGQVNAVTERNYARYPLRYRSPYRPGNTALTDANEHASKVRHRNRRARWCDRWLPFRWGWRRR